MQSILLYSMVLSRWGRRSTYMRRDAREEGGCDFSSKMPRIMSNLPDFPRRPFLYAHLCVYTKSMLARDILSVPNPPPDVYELLKERLLRLYDKGEKDRCRRLLSMPPLGGRRPSELLAEMLQLCPRDDADGRLIRYMFLFRLPPTVQSMLGEDDTSPIADLAARADALMDAETAKENTVAAAVEEATVAAAGAAAPSAARKRKQDWARKKKKPAAHKSSGDGDGGNDPGPWQDMGLCWSHYNWGSKARNCKPPCARAGN